MAINIDTQDLINFPGTVKRVSVDIASIVPTNVEGDEKYVLQTSTSAYSDNAGRTAIQSLYITDLISGWCKSSGFAGASGKFSIDDTHNTLKIRMDATISGSSGDGFYNIELTPNSDGTPVHGQVIAEELKQKIRSIANYIETADIGFTNAYRNASVEFKNNKFIIVSGSVSSSYTGNYRSSVIVEDGDSSGCASVLGFDLPTTSYSLANIAVNETLLNTSYSPDTSDVSVNTGLGAQEGMPFMITDGVNTDYFVSLSGTTDSLIKVATLVENGYSAITNSYAGGEAKIQLLRYQDPEAKPTSWFDSIDQLVRYGVKVMMNQIDYSS
jgi:hypothetical protein